MELYVLIVSIFFLVYWYWNYARLPKNLPPGPVGVPFLGYIPFMGTTHRETFSKLKAKFGDIFCLYIGQKLFVVLASNAVAKEALIKQGDNFAGRPVLVSAVPPEFNDTKGIGLNSGKLFNEFKQISLSVIKTFTRSDGNGESIITNEIQYLQREIDQTQGKPTDISELISTSVINVIWYCLFSERMDKNDDDFNTMLYHSRRRLEAIQLSGIEIAFPQIFHIPFVRKIFQASIAMDSYSGVHNYFNDKITQQETSAKAKKEFNFVQEWFKLHPRESDDHDFYRKQLTPVLTDLFGAASETTVKFLQWAILYVMQYPDIQRRVQAEIKEVIGKFNKPSMMDKNKMPFTEATLMEVHRISPVTPFSLPHVNSKTSIVNGYTIPENSIIITNIWEMHHNPETFPNPESFRPDRFLDNGVLKRVEELIPFSIGKRQCIGKSLAQMELFLTFTSLLQRYTFKKPKGVQLDFTYDFMAAVGPRQYKLIATPN